MLYASQNFKRNEIHFSLYMLPTMIPASMVKRKERKERKDRKVLKWMKAISLFKIVVSTIQL